MKAEVERVRRKHPESLDAYDLYLKAVPMVYSADVPSYSNAIKLLDQAVALDPRFAPVLAAGAWAHEKRLTFGGVAPAGVDDKAMAIDLARQALAADPDDAMVLAIAGWFFILLLDDFGGGLTLSKRALALNPNGLLLLHFGGIAHGYCGDLDESIACHTRALQISPGALDTYMNLTGLAFAHIYAGRFEAAIECALQSLDTHQNWELTFECLAIAYAHLDRMEEARDMVRRVVALRPEPAGPWVVSRPFPFPERMAYWNDGRAKAWQSYNEHSAANARQVRR